METPVRNRMYARAALAKATTLWCVRRQISVIPLERVTRQREHAQILRRRMDQFVMTQMHVRRVIAARVGPAREVIPLFVARRINVIRRELVTRQREHVQTLRRRMARFVTMRMLVRRQILVKAERAPEVTLSFAVRRISVTVPERVMRRREHAPILRNRMVRRVMI